MTTGRKVSVTVQVLLVSLVPFANVWAFYRIRRLRRVAAYVAVPTAVVIATVLVLFDPFATYFCPDEEIPPGMYSDRHRAVCLNLFPYNIHGIGLLITGWIAMHAWQVYLIHRWSGEWNDRFGDRGSEEPRGA